MYLGLFDCVETFGLFVICVCFSFSELVVTFGPILVTVGQMILRNNLFWENNPALCFGFRCYCLASANTGTGSYRPKLPKTTKKMTH